jgi:hypothetical protein
LTFLKTRGRIKMNIETLRKNFNATYSEHRNHASGLSLRFYQNMSTDEILATLHSRTRCYAQFASGAKVISHTKLKELGWELIGDTEKSLMLLGLS